MPGYDWSQLPATARGAFGLFQRIAQERQTTTEAWDSIRSWADSQALQDLRRAGNAFPSIDELAAASRPYTRGWGVHTVNAMRGLAGAWLRTKQALQRIRPQEVPTGDSIFRPPWATSSDIPGVETTYRFRVKLRITPPGEGAEPMYQWTTLFHTGPITSVSDLLGGSLLQGMKDRYRMGGGPLNLNVNDVAVEDYELEAM